MSGTLTGLGPLLRVRVTAEPTSTSLPAAGSVLTATPAGTLALKRCSVSPTWRPAARDGGDGIGLGEALDLGHEGEGRAGADGVADAGARGHLGTGGWILGQDGVLGCEVIDDAAVTDDEPGGLDGGPGILLQGAHDVGHADRLGTLAQGEGDGGADLDLAARGGVGLDGDAGGDAGVEALLGVADLEAGGGDGGDRIGLGEALRPRARAVKGGPELTV